MKKYIFCISFTVFHLFTSYSQSWVNVGANEFYPNAKFQNLAFDKNRVPHISLSNDGNFEKVAVIKYDSIAKEWNYVGNTEGFSFGKAAYTYIVFDSNNKPYVLYMDGKPSDSPASSVVTFDGTNWITIGSHIVPDENNKASIIARDTVIYITYSPNNGIGPAFVQKYDGSSWDYLGSDLNGSFLRLAFSSTDVPYLVFIDNDFSRKATLVKFDGSDWIQVGQPGFSHLTNLEEVQIAIDSQDNIYVAYVGYYNESSGTGGQASVMKYSGTNWETVGYTEITGGGSKNLNLAIDSEDKPFLAYKDYTAGKRNSVIKFDGSSWDYVGDQGFTSTIGSTDYQSFVFNNGVPYIAYQNSGKRTCFQKFCQLPPAPSVSNNLNICPGGSTTLTASGILGGTIGWYSASSGGSYLGGGNSFITQPLTEETTFFVQDSISSCGPSQLKKSVTVGINHVSISGPTSICSGDSAVLYANGADSYIWDNGSLLNQITVSPITTTTFSVTGTINSSNCATSSSISISVVSCDDTYISENSSDRFIQIYPNPISNGKIFVKYELEKIAHHNLTIKIIDVTGKEVSIATEKKRNNNVSEYDLSGLPDGIYYLQFGSSIPIYKKVVLLKEF